MASWKESMGRMAQNAMTKSKEMVEINRLNREISTSKQKIKDLYTATGEYLMAHPELVDTADETFAANMEQLSQLEEKIEQTQQTLLEVQNINICPNCGAQVNRSSKFCDRCGTEMQRIALSGNTAEVKPKCPNCGAEVEENSTFCGECGTKLTAETVEQKADSQEAQDSAQTVDASAGL